jgi:sulfur-oxidizing protein SoxX
MRGGIWTSGVAAVALMVAGGLLGAALLGCSAASAAPADGQKLAFDRAKGNCLTCHEIKDGPAPGNLGPPLADMKARFPDRKELIAIISDETKRNPLTVMPPFKRNLILNDKEIEEIVDFLQTL